MELGWKTWERTGTLYERADWRRGILIPFGACSAVALLLLLMDGSVRWRTAGPALGLQLAVAAGTALAPRVGLDRWRPSGSLAIVAYLLSVAMVRDGTGAFGGFGPLVLVPVIWASLRGRRDELAVAVLGVALVYIAPAVLIGGSRYPAGSWRSGVLFAVISATLGVTVIQLVRRVQTLLGELTEQAGTDELTGLPNRRAWEEALARELGAAATGGQPVTVVLLDIDYFKDYNDAHGHLAGDRMLRAGTSAWHAVLRNVDMLARWGGDEFGLLLPGCGVQQARQVLQRMRDAASDLQFSAGVAQWRPEESAHELLIAADEALYQAKAGERNTDAVARG